VMNVFRSPRMHTSKNSLGGRGLVNMSAILF